MQQFETQEKTQVQKTYVALRLRPIQSHEKFCEKNQTAKQQYILIRVFDENEDTQVIFDQMVQPMLDKSLCGFNALICAYGQTSSGKTYTMKGCAQSLGLIQYSAKHLFNQISKYKGSRMTMQYLEIYQEQIYDLLSHDKDMKSLKNKFHCQQVEIKTPNQLLEYQQFILFIIFFIKNSKFGEDKRHFGETSMNIESSRSHVILELVLSVPVHEGKAIKRRESKVLFVDLAGSEGATKDVNTVRKQEGSKINKSLLAFCNVVNRIKENQVSGKDEYINYRDSQLTVCLKTCLEGNSQLGFLFTVNQSISNSAQSLTTIQFSKNAGAIKSELIVNEVISESSGEFDKRIRELTEENQQLNEQVENQEKIIQQLKEQIQDQNKSLSESETEKYEFKRTIKQLTFSNNSLQKEVNQYKDWNNQLQDQKESFETKIAILEKQQAKQNAIQQKENVEPINKPQQEEIKVDLNKGKVSIVKEKQVKQFEDESQLVSFRAQAQQSKRQSATFPALITNQKENNQLAKKSRCLSPTISDLSDCCSLYLEIRSQKLRNFFLQEQLVEILQDNLKLQKQNDDYEKLLKHKIYDDEDYGDMKQFYENMEIAPEQPKKQNKQIQPRMSQQSTYQQTYKMLEHLKLNYKSSTKYVEQLFNFMEVTFGQDRKQLCKQFAEFTKEQILLDQ